MKRNIQSKNLQKFILIILGFHSIICFSQNYDKSLLEQITPTDPTSSSLGKYGVYPVNYSNGLVPISIPLYTIKSGDLSQTIELSYHGGGVRVSEEATWVGLGWDLNFGGVITRTMNGFPDELETQIVPDAIAMQTEILSNSLQCTEYDICNNYYNASTPDKSFKPDLYNYNFGSYSGTFVSSTTNKPISIAHAALDGLISSNGINLVAPNGTIYDFIGNESTSSSGSLVKNGPYVSGFYINRILSANKTDSISYEYQPDGIFRSNSYSTSEGYKVTTSLSSCGYQALQKQFVPEVTTMITQTIESNKPNYIYFNGGRVKFNLTDRSDVNPTFPNRIKKLDNIVVEAYDAGMYDVIKVFQFYYSFFNQGGDYNATRLCLDSVVEMSSFQSTERKLVGSFNYYGDKFLPNKRSYDYDYWGFYNGKNNSTPIPFSINEDYCFGEADKTPDATFSKYGTIKNINFPTKGKTEFIWEGNRINSNSPIYEDINMTSNNISSETNTLLVCYPKIPNPEFDGVKSVTIHSYIDQYIKLNYYLYRQDEVDITHNKYDEGIIKVNDLTIATLSFNHSTFSKIIHLVANQDYQINLTTNCHNVSGGVWFSYNTFNPNNNIYNYPFAGIRIKEINNYDKNNNLLTKKTFTYLDSINRSSGYITNNRKMSFSKHSTYVSVDFGGLTCKVVKQIDSYMWFSNSNNGLEANSFGYESVQEYNMSNNINNGFTSFQFKKGVDGFYTTTGSDNFYEAEIPVVLKNHTRGQLLKQTDYLSTTNGYKKIKENLNYYSNGIIQSKPGFTMLRKVDFNNSTAFLDYCSLVYIFEPKNYTYTSDWIKLDSTITKDYFQLSNPVSTKTSYVYGNEKHLQPTEVKSYLNNGDIKKTNTIYPNDDNSTIAGDMVFRNMLILPLDIKEYVMKNGSAQKLIDGNKLTYEKINNNILLTKVAGYLPDGTTDDYFLYNYNTRSRLIESTGKDGVKTSVIWDAKNYNPIVEAVNMSYSNLWSAMQSVNNVPSALYSLDATKPAQLSTYSYIPLVGLHSKTNERGLVTYYNYDGLGRLSEMYRMVNGVKQVLQSYKYHYK